MAIFLSFTDRAFACTASMPQKIRKSGSNATDRPGRVDGRWRWLLPTKSAEPLSFMFSSTWTVMGASLKNASTIAKTSTNDLIRCRNASYF